MHSSGCFDPNDDHNSEGIICIYLSDYCYENLFFQLVRNF